MLCIILNHCSGNFKVKNDWKYSQFIQVLRASCCCCCLSHTWAAETFCLEYGEGDGQFAMSGPLFHCQINAMNLTPDMLLLLKAKINK